MKASHASCPLLQGFTRHSAVGVNAPRIFGIQMTDLFFQQPILNSPYDYPGRHWELDTDGQPTSKILIAAGAPTSLPRCQSPRSVGRLPRRPASVCIPETGSRRTSRSIIRRRSLTRCGVSLRIGAIYRTLINGWSHPRRLGSSSIGVTISSRACAVISQASLIDWNCDAQDPLH